MRPLLLIFFMISADFGLVSAQSLQRKAIDHIKDATVYIQVIHRFPLNGEEAPVSGTGFFINDKGHVVTNYHVIQPMVLAYGIYFPTVIKHIRVFRNSGTQKHKVSLGHVLAVDKENDLAVLGIEDMAESPFLKVGEAEKLFETMPVWVFGYPFGDAFTVIQRGPEITVTKGSLSALRHDDRGKLSQIQIDAAVNPGNSGGPVINEQGRVAGVVKIAMGTSQVNFAVPPQVLRDLLAKVPQDKDGEDTIAVEVTSSPAGASLFIDWSAQGNTPTQNMRMRRGWHTLTLMKQGYEAWNREQSFYRKQSMDAAMVPVRALPVTLSPGTGAAGDLAGDKLPVFSPAPPGKNILLEESFNNKEVFDTWEQYTGGTDTRTWFLEEGALHQFESTKVLHAIYLGDTAWSDYLLQARVKITDEHDDSRAGLIFRETADGFYLFRIHKESDKAQLAYHCKGPFGWFILEEKKLGMDVGDKWYDMAVRVNGNMISCYLDTKCIFHTAGKYAARGRIGFYSVESKASFDSLVVTRITGRPAAGNKGQGRGLLSFWFSDYFNLKSTWWYQYNPVSYAPEPWRMSDAGCVLLGNDDRTRVSEFTRYEFTNFALELVASLGEGGDKSSFEIFFRKTSEGRLVLKFSKREKKVILTVMKGAKEKILKKKSLPGNFFSNTVRLTLAAKGQEIICTVMERKLLSFKSRRVSTGQGRIGFASTGLPLVLHQMTVSSPR